METALQRNLKIPLQRIRGQRKNLRKFTACFRVKPSRAARKNTPKLLLKNSAVRCKAWPFGRAAINPLTMHFRRTGRALDRLAHVQNSNPKLDGEALAAKTKRPVQRGKRQRIATLQTNVPRWIADWTLVYERMVSPKPRSEL